MQQLDGGDAALTKAITSDSQLNRFELLPVQPWGFSGPLNAAVVRASALGATHVAFVSVEVTIEPEQIQQMLSLFTPRTSSPHRTRIALTIPQARWSSARR